MTLKGEIVDILNTDYLTIKQCEEYAEQILSAIKGRVPKENLPPSGSLEDKYSYLAGQRKGFNDCRNQFLNEVEG